MDKEKEGGLTAEEAAQLDQQILALENSLKVLESKMMEIEHDIGALHEHEKLSRNSVADGEAVQHAEGPFSYSSFIMLDSQVDDFLGPFPLFVHP